MKLSHIAKHEGLRFSELYNEWVKTAEGAECYGDMDKAVMRAKQ